MRTPATLLPRIGEALLQIQEAEKVLKLFMTHHVRGLGMSWEDLVRLEDKDRSKTLGRVIAELRKSILVREEFAEELSQFAKDRNIFVHSFSSIPGFNFDTQDGLSIAMDFVISLTLRAIRITGVITALIRILKGVAKVQYTEIGPEFDEEADYELTAIGRFCSGA